MAVDREKLTSDLSHLLYGTGTLDEVQAILQQRDENGVPYADVNECSCQTAIHATLFSKHTAEEKRLMVQAILGLRDHQNNLIPNLNIMHRNAGTALVAAIDNNDLVLLQQLLDARNADGSPAVDLLASGRHGEFWSPMTRALFMDRRAVVEWLVDARQANGEPILSQQDLEQALLGAHCNGGRATHQNSATEWLCEHLHIPLEALRDERIREFITRYPRLEDRNPQVVRQQFVVQAAAAPMQDAQVAAFVNAGQNTHNTEVTVSVEASLQRLKKRYGTQQNVDALLTEIEAHIRQGNYGANKDTALACVARIRKNKLVRGGPDLTQAQALALVWHAASDKNTIVDDVVVVLNDKDINDRRQTIVNHLHLAQTTYGPDNPACFVGTFNKIVEGLDHVHRDVMIMTGRANVLPVASERVLILIRDELMLLSNEEQIRILKTWGATEGDSPAATFRNRLVQLAKNTLKSEYQTLLTADDRDGITDNIIYSPRPGAPHKALNELVDQIENASPTGTDPKKQVLRQIKMIALQLYETSLKDADKHDLLQKLWNLYLENTFEAEQPTEMANIIPILMGTYSPIKSGIPARDQFVASLGLTAVTATSQEAQIHWLDRYFALMKLDAVVKDLQPIFSRYQGTSQKRIRLLKDLGQRINDAYQTTMTAPSSNLAQSLQDRAFEIRREVQADHKRTGALRFFRSLQPESRLVKAMSQSLPVNQQAITEFLKDTIARLAIKMGKRNKIKVEELKKFLALIESDQGSCSSVKKLMELKVKGVEHNFFQVLNIHTLFNIGHTRSLKEFLTFFNQDQAISKADLTTILTAKP